MSEELTEEPSPPSSSSSSSASPGPDSMMSDESDQTLGDDYTMSQEEFPMQIQVPSVPEHIIQVADPEIPMAGLSDSYEPDLSEQIDFMLGEFGKGPEPFYPVPEEFQPMLDQLQTSPKNKGHAPPEYLQRVPDIPCNGAEFNCLSYFKTSGQSNQCDIVPCDFQEIPHTFLPISNGEQRAIPAHESFNTTQDGNEFNAINELCQVMGEEEQSSLLGNSTIYPSVLPAPMPYEESPNPYLPGPSYQYDISMMEQIQQLPNNQEMPEMAQMNQMLEMPHMEQHQYCDLTQMAQAPLMAQVPSNLQLPHMPQMAMDPQVLQPMPTLRQLLSPPKMNEPLNQLLPVPHQAEPNVLKGYVYTFIVLSYFIILKVCTNNHSFSASFGFVSRQSYTCRSQAGLDFLWFMEMSVIL